MDSDLLRSTMTTKRVTCKRWVLEECSLLKIEKAVNGPLTVWHFELIKGHLENTKLTSKTPLICIFTVYPTHPY